MSEPMNLSSIHFKNYRCFKFEEVGFDSIKNINIIIGKNNSGKSCLLDLIAASTDIDKSNTGSECEFIFKNTITRRCAEILFPKESYLGFQSMSFWRTSGEKLIGTDIIWSKSPNNPPQLLEYQVEVDDSIEHRFVDGIITMRKDKILNNINKFFANPLQGKTPRKVSAERDIVPEQINTSNIIDQSGSGATSSIYNYLMRSDKPREIITSNILNAFNEIMSPDVELNEISIQQHDNGKYEVYLSDRKGFIPLSHSGSGLKTIILVLLNLILVPHIDNKSPSDYIFIFEELENNLHPEIQRRLFNYITKFSLDYSSIFFITTHSSVVLDIFAERDHSQIMHITNNGSCSKIKKVSGHFDALEAIGDIGCKPSDLLQSNGIVWLEGPSDRIYFNKWVQLLSDNTLKEGRDYQCAFYGGSLLSRYEAVESQLETEDRINILRINPNAILLCDGDRTAKEGKGSRIKQRAIRLKQEISKITNGYTWITQAKEIESYIPVECLRSLWKKDRLQQIGVFTPFWREKSKGKSPGYFQRHSPKKTVDKVQLAQDVVRLVSLSDLETLFDWHKEMSTIVKRIENWN